MCACVCANITILCARWKVSSGRCAKVVALGSEMESCAAHQSAGGCRTPDGQKTGSDRSLLVVGRRKRVPGGFVPLESGNKK